MLVWYLGGFGLIPIFDADLNTDLYALNADKCANKSVSHSFVWWDWFLYLYVKNYCNRFDLPNCRFKWFIVHGCGFNIHTIISYFIFILFCLNIFFLLFNQVMLDSLQQIMSNIILFYEEFASAWRTPWLWSCTISFIISSLFSNRKWKRHLLFGAPQKVT